MSKPIKLRVISHKFPLPIDLTPKWNELFSNTPYDEMPNCVLLAIYTELTDIDIKQEVATILEKRIHQNGLSNDVRGNWEITVKSLYSSYMEAYYPRAKHSVENKFKGQHIPEGMMEVLKNQENNRQIYKQVRLEKESLYLYFKLVTKTPSIV